MAPPKLSDESDALYMQLVKAAEASSEGIKKTFFQPDVHELLGKEKKVDKVMKLVQELMASNLLRTVMVGKQIAWTVRPRDAARQIAGLSTQEGLFYKCIEEAHEKGIWLKEIKNKTGINAAQVADKIIKKLESTNLIKSVKNVVRGPMQKTYMLYHLVPSDDVTGGSFFDAGDLDASLIEELSNLIVFHVQQQSWVNTKPKKVKREASPVDIEDDDSADEVQPKKRRRHTADIEDAASPRKHRSNRHDPETDVITQLAYPAGSRNYPTAESIHQFITNTDAIRASKRDFITLEEIKNVCSMLVWDDRLERVGNGYRTVRGVSFKPPSYPVDQLEEERGRVGNGLTQTPCGRCPVFDLCEDGGPINAASCVYFKEWLDMGL